MATLRQVREVAKLICETATGICVQVHDAGRRTECTDKNCSIMPIAREALRKASQVERFGKTAEKR